MKELKFPIVATSTAGRYHVSSSPNPNLNHNRLTGKTYFCMRYKTTCMWCLPCMFLAHHELENVIVVVVVIIIIFVMHVVRPSWGCQAVAASDSQLASHSCMLLTGT